MLSCTLTRDLGPGSWFKDGVKVLSPPFTNVFGVRTERRGEEGWGEERRERRGEGRVFILIFLMHLPWEFK